MQSLSSNWNFNVQSLIQYDNIPLYGNQFEIVGSKSISHRLLIMAALKTTPSFLRNFLFAEDTLVLSKNLNLLGIQFKYLSNGLWVYPILNQHDWFKKGYQLQFYFQNSAASLRFFLALLLLFKGEFNLNASEQLKNRPIDFIFQTLESLNIKYQFQEKKNSLPIKINNNEKANIKELKISVRKTSQWLSGILLIMPYLNNGTRIILDQKIKQSESYVYLTEKLVFQYSTAKIIKNSNKNLYEVKHSGSYHFPEKYYIEGDLTHASYFFNGIALLGGKLKIIGVSNLSLQSDLFYCYFLENLGARFKYDKHYIEMEGPIKKPESDLVINMQNHLDLVPSLAVLGCFFKAKLKIVNIKNLIYKESNRLQNLYKELKKLGVIIELGEDFLSIQARPYQKYNKHCILESYQDHRLAMAFSLFELYIEGLKIKDKSSVKKSFPHYFKLWNFFLKSKQIKA